MSPTGRLLEREESHIHKLLIQMSEASITMLQQAMQSVENVDHVLAQEVVDADPAVNQLCENVERESVSSIALRQPVATDLRDLFADAHIANELERIADHAAGIAKIALRLELAPEKTTLLALKEIATRCEQMLIEVMHAYKNLDAKQANEVAEQDSWIDDAEQALVESLLENLCAEHGNSRQYTHLIWMAHGLERIGDRITNIAERITYIATGKSVELN